MKKFLLLGGAVLGLALLGYTAFAFQAPLTDPPGGNVDPPVNVGSGFQTKTGGLSVGSLQIEGGTTLNTAGGGGPACDSTIQGTLWFTTGPPGALQICAVSGGVLDWYDVWRGAL